MKKTFLLKLLVPLLAASINLSGFTVLNQTRSFFSDQELSADNLLVADPLGFSVDAGEFAPDVSDGQSAGLPLTITNHYREDFVLTFIVRNPAGGLCSDLVLSAASQEFISGSADLQTFNYQPGLQSATNGIWYLSASLREGGSGQGQSCNFEIAVYGEQPGGGYSYEQTVAASVRAASMPEIDTALENDDHGGDKSVVSISTEPDNKETEDGATEPTEYEAKDGEDNLSPLEIETNAPVPENIDVDKKNESGQSESVDLPVSPVLTDGGQEAAAAPQQETPVTPESVIDVPPPPAEPASQIQTPET